METCATLEKCVTFENMRHTCKKSVRLEKMCPTWQKAARLKNYGKLEQNHAPHFKNCTTLGKARYIWKNAPQLGKCTTLGKNHHT